MSDEFDNQKDYNKKFLKKHIEAKKKAKRLTNEEKELEHQENEES